MLEVSEEVEEFCPFVGLAEDPQTRLAYPSVWNVCYHVSPPDAPRVEHQRLYCLRSGYKACLVLRRERNAPLPEAIRAPAAKSIRREWGTGWVVAVAFGLIALGFVSGWLTRTILPLSSVKNRSSVAVTFTPSKLAGGTWTSTSSPLPSARPTGETVSPTSTVTPLPTATPTTTPPVCFQLISPQDGAQLPNKGGILFSWGEQTGAAAYILTFTIPSGLQVSFEGQVTEHKRYMESLIMGGTYTWQVTALDAAGKAICSAKPYTFSKPVVDTPTPTGGPAIPANTPASALTP